MRLGSTGVCIFRSPFYLLYRQTYRGGVSIDRELRIEISARFAPLFRSSVIRGASGRYIRDCIRAITFSHCFSRYVCSFPGVYPVGCAVAFRPGVFQPLFRGTFRRKILPLLALPLERRTPPVSCIPFCRVPGGRLSLPPTLGAFDTPGNRNRRFPGCFCVPVSVWLWRMRSTHQSPTVAKMSSAVSNLASILVAVNQFRQFFCKTLFVHRSFNFWVYTLDTAIRRMIVRI